ncbi:lactosylceramide 4-alpha-galactosyltransferase-like [Onthophagus taurus]|uniref:lactosylceramide 4-alpha-galactosyltransferase-like n=1 Tax=Onthophagus taurus TaxID=166361 RepID=UPI0039BE3FD7
MNAFQRVFIIIISFGFFYFITYILLATKPPNDDITIILKKNRQILRNLFDLTIKNNSIFFLETSFKDFEHEVVTINRRASCSLESAALYHRNRSIYYIYVFPNDIKTIYIQDKYLNTVLTYENVHVVYAKIEDLVKNTEIEGLFKKHLIETSDYFVEHFSDAFRVIVLMKFGGIYMDSDVIVLKSLDDLGGNFIGKEFETSLAGGIIGFDGNSIDLLDRILKDFNEHYNPKSWTGHGPFLFTKWVKKLCNATRNFLYHKCDHLKVLPTNLFYPIFYGSWEDLFDPEYVDEVLDKAKNSYLIHFWNKLSYDLIIDSDSNAAYTVLAKKHCPKTFSKLNKLF